MHNKNTKNITSLNSLLYKKSPILRNTKCQCYNDNVKKDKGRTLKEQKKMKNLERNETKKYYYEFGYFFNNKDSGSLHVITNKPLDEDDVDECVNYAYNNGLISKEYVNNIIYIEELSKKDAKEMGFNVD